MRRLLAKDVAQIGVEHQVQIAPRRTQGGKDFSRRTEPIRSKCGASFTDGHERASSLARAGATVTSLLLSSGAALRLDPKLNEKYGMVERRNEQASIWSDAV